MLLLVTVMPFVVIFPALVTLPMKVAFVMVMAFVVPVKSVALDTIIVIACPQETYGSLNPVSFPGPNVTTAPRR